MSSYHNEMTELPQSLFGAREVRELDRVAIEDLHIDAYVLMRRAGQAAFDCLRAEWPRAEGVTVVCGSGNNGGDGYVVAELALRAKWPVTVIAVKPPGTDVARRAYADYQAAGGSALAWPVTAPADRGVIVDGVLGTGLERTVTGVYAHAIEYVNSAGRPVLALDVPSGLHADTGRVMGCAVKAQLTVAFIGLKIGLFTGSGRECAGRIRFSDLAVPASTYRAVKPRAQRIDPYADGLLPAGRARDAHKGIAGRVLIVGGNRGMAGAARMSGEAAYRAGAGLVEIAAPAEQAPVIGAGCPELMVNGVDPRHWPRPWARVSAVAVGPGLGQDDWAMRMFSLILESPVPAVVDADALNLLSTQPEHRDNWILTPHPGEAARLLGATPLDVQADRPAAVAALVERYGGVVVLKGSGTLVAAAHRTVSLCDRGNPGMASGGMGDVLTGIIAGLLAQGGDPWDAARLGVWVHARAADEATRGDGEIGLMATDLLPWVRRILNGEVSDPGRG